MKSVFRLMNGCNCDRAVRLRRVRNRAEFCRSKNLQARPQIAFCLANEIRSEKRIPSELTVIRLWSDSFEAFCREKVLAVWKVVALHIV